MIRKILTLRNIRRAYAVFFMVLFVVLLWLTSFRRLKGYETPLFLELDPLALTHEQGRSGFPQSTLDKSYRLWENLCTRK
jgi:hypothetical protein